MEEVTESLKEYVLKVMRESHNANPQELDALLTLVGMLINNANPPYDNSIAEERKLKDWPPKMPKREQSKDGKKTWDKLTIELTKDAMVISWIGNND